MLKGVNKRNVGRGVWIDGARCSFFLSLIAGKINHHLRYDSTGSPLLLLPSHNVTRSKSWYIWSIRNMTMNVILWSLIGMMSWGHCIMCAVKPSLWKGSKDLTETMIINQWLITILFGIYKMMRRSRWYLLQNGPRNEYDGKLANSSGAYMERAFACQRSEGHVKRLVILNMTAVIIRNKKGTLRINVPHTYWRIDARHIHTWCMMEFKIGICIYTHKQGEAAYSMCVVLCVCVCG